MQTPTNKQPSAPNNHQKRRADNKAKKHLKQTKPQDYTTNNRQRIPMTKATKINQPTSINNRQKNRITQNKRQTTNGKQRTNNKHQTINTKQQQKHHQTEKRKQRTTNLM